MTGTTSQTVNIGRNERELRRLLGILVIFLTIFAAVALWWLEAAPAWSLVLLPFYYQGVQFVLEYSTGTSPRKAELGQEKLDARFSILSAKIQDAGRIKAIRTKSRKALVQALAAAAVLTAGTFFLVAGA